MCVFVQVTHVLWTPVSFLCKTKINRTLLFLVVRPRCVHTGPAQRKEQDLQFPSWGAMHIPVLSELTVQRETARPHPTHTSDFLTVLLVCLCHPGFSTYGALQQVKRMSKGVCNPFYWTANSLGRELGFHSSRFTTCTWVLGIWKWNNELRPIESREREKSGHPPGPLLGEAEVYVFLE